jgi:hypothetical protein
MENKKPCSLFGEQGWKFFRFFELADFLLPAGAFLKAIPRPAMAAQRDSNANVVSHLNLIGRHSSHERGRTMDALEIPVKAYADRKNSPFE